MGRKERIIWIFLLSVSITISVLVITIYQANLNIANQKITRLEGEKKTWIQKEAYLTSEIADLKTQLEKVTAVIDKLPITDSAIAKKMEQKGLSGGTNQVIYDLLKHNEIIPFEGVLGGEMVFFKDRILVVSDKWVLAYFEDGHISGYMLLSFSIKNGNVSWKVIDSYLTGQ